MEAEMKAEAHTPVTAHGQHPEVGHVVPLWLLAAVGGVLLVLTWVTVAVTAFDFGPVMNLLIAMLIALVKAVLVALFFMHLWWDRPINMIVFVSALFFVTIFVVLVLMDKGTYKPDVAAYWAARDPAPEVQSWQAAEAAQAVAEAESEESAPESAAPPAQDDAHSE